MKGDKVGDKVRHVHVPASLDESLARLSEIEGIPVTSLIVKILDHHVYGNRILRIADGREEVTG